MGIFGVSILNAMAKRVFLFFIFPFSFLNFLIFLKNSFSNERMQTNRVGQCLLKKAEKIFIVKFYWVIQGFGLFVAMLCILDIPF